MSLYTAFFLGFAGSLHCAAMCGPLVLALAGGRRGSWPWLYHGGRFVMYSVLGAISGGAGAILLWAGLQRGLSIFSGGAMLAAAIFLARGAGGGFNQWLKSRFSFLVKGRSLAATIGMGALNGLLPCGLVYLALAAAAATGSIAGGMTTMLAFGLGTFPMLLGINVAGRKFVWANPARWRRTAIGFAMLAGGLLILRGMSLGIPYVSPILVDGKTPVCCQPVIHNSIPSH